MNVTLPIVARELRVRARQPATWWMRALIGLVAFVSVSWIFLLPPSAGPANQMGRYAFTSISWLLSLFCLVEGVRLTHDSLSRERREGTLGLLFLTDLRGLDVVLGKLTAHGWSAFQGVLAILPVLAASLLLGGVTGLEVVRTALALVNALLAALALGLWVSSRHEDEGRALGASLGWLLAWLGLPWVAELLWKMLNGGPLNDVFPAVLSPVTPLILADAGLFRAWPYWLSLGLTHLLAWLLVARSAWNTGRNWREGAAVAAVPRAAASASPDHATVGERPVEWLVNRLPGQRARAWWAILLLTASSLVSLGGAMVMGLGASSAQLRMLFYWGGLLTGLGGMVLLAAVAARPLRELRQSGLAELLLTTPLAAAELGADCWRTLWRTIRLPLAAMVLVNLGYRFVLPLFAANVSNSFPGVLGLAMLVISPVVLVLALVQTGLWFAANSRKPGQAAVQAVFWVWLVPFLCLRVLPLHLVFGWFLPFTPTLYALLYQGLPATYYLGCFLWARKRFRTRLRRALLRDPLVAAEAIPPDAGLRGAIRRARNWQAD